MQEPENMRSKTFNIRLTEVEAERLAALADYHATSAAGLVRMLLSEAAIDAAAETTKATERGAKPTEVERRIMKTLSSAENRAVGARYGAARTHTRKN